MDSEGISGFWKYGGSINRDTISLPEELGLSDEELEGISYSGTYTKTFDIAKWSQVLAGVGVVAASVITVIFVVDDMVGNVGNDASIPGLLTYIGGAWGQVQEIGVQLQQCITQLKDFYPLLQNYVQNMSLFCAV